MIAPENDLDRIMAVMQVAFDPAFGEAWTRRQVADALLVGNCRYCLINQSGSIAEDGDEAAGFFLSRHSYLEEELLLIAVSPACRRMGLGRRLLELFAARAKEAGASSLVLEMRRGNGAESLYTSFGFRPVGVRPNYYRSLEGNRIDAITLTLQAPDSV